MKLEKTPMKDLLTLHNQIADKPAGPKSFATRPKLVARIQLIAKQKNIDLTSLRQFRTVTTTTAQADPMPTSAESTHVIGQKSLSTGVGTLARGLLLDPLGWPYAYIVEIVNSQVAGAQTTIQSVRWYASELRRKGYSVPERKKAFPADMHAKQAAAWQALSSH